MEPIGNPLKTLSAQGDPAAQTKLGIVFLERMICIDDYIALDLLKKAAAKGNTEAKFRLGMMYGNGRGISPSKSTALFWYRQAALENHPDALFAFQMRTSKNPLLTKNMSILDLAETAISLPQLKTIAQGIKKTAIKALHLKGNKLEDEAVKALSIYLKGSKVRTLDLWKNKISSEGLIELADSLKDLKLEILDLAENFIDDKGVIHLAGKVSQTSLHTLHLGNNLIGTPGAEALAKQLPQSQLKVLDIGKNKLETSGINAFLNQFQQSRLALLDIAENTKTSMGNLQINLDESSIEYLDLKLNKLSDDQIFELCKTFQRSRVSALNLRDNAIGPLGAITLARTMPKTLKLLNLRGNPIKDEGAFALAKAIQEMPLETLNLSGCEINSKGFQKILDALNQSEIHTLNLGGNRVGVEPLVFTFSQKLKSLDLAGNRLGVENGKRLAERLKKTSLEYCDFSGNNFGEVGLRSIFYNLPATLKTLNISSNDAGPQGWDLFFNHLTATQISQLILTNNRIGNQGLNLTETSLRRIHLESFSLENNGIDVDGIARFSLCMPPSLRTLNLSLNPLGDEGLAILLKNLKNTHIHTLRLCNCGITDTGAKLLLDTNLHSVVLNGNNISGAMLNRLKQHLEIGNVNDLTENKKIPLNTRDISIVVDNGYSLEDFKIDALDVLQDDSIYIDHFDLIEEVAYNCLVEKAIKNLGIQKHQKNLVIRIFFKNMKKPLTRKEQNDISNKIYNSLNRREKQ